jgi:hypothetical protein
MRLSTRLERGMTITHLEVVETQCEVAAVFAKTKKTGTASFSFQALISSALLGLSPIRAKSASLQGEALASRSERSAPSPIQTRLVHHGVLNA